jgi:hypothetical protein
MLSSLLLGGHRGCNVTEDTKLTTHLLLGPKLGGKELCLHSACAFKACARTSHIIIIGSTALGEPWPPLEVS